MIEPPTEPTPLISASGLHLRVTVCPLCWCLVLAEHPEQHLTRCRPVAPMNRNDSPERTDR